MYGYTGRCTDCGAAVGMRHDADCPNARPQSDAQGEPCHNWACRWYDTQHTQPCAPYQRGMERVGTEPPAPPSAPASAPDAEGFKTWWEQEFGDSLSDEVIAKYGWDAGFAAAQRQHAACPGYGYVLISCAVCAPEEAAPPAATTEGRAEHRIALLEAETKALRLIISDHHDTTTMAKLRSGLPCPVCSTVPVQPPPAEQHGPCEECDLSGPEAARRYHAWAATQPPPAATTEGHVKAGAIFRTCPECHAGYWVPRVHADHTPPPADADVLRDEPCGFCGYAKDSGSHRARCELLADWQDCAHCHHWGHQHKGGVCCVCDKRDETCGLFAALAAPQPPAGEG